VKIYSRLLKKVSIFPTMTKSEFIGLGLSIELMHKKLSDASEALHPESPIIQGYAECFNAMLDAVEPGRSAPFRWFIEKCKWGSDPQLWNGNFITSLSELYEAWHAVRLQGLSEG
jgi:hypothetical protein